MPPSTLKLISRGQSGQSSRVVDIVHDACVHNGERCPAACGCVYRSACDAGQIRVADHNVALPSCTASQADPPTAAHGEGLERWSATGTPTRTVSPPD